MVSIKLVNISKKGIRKQILENISLTVNDKELFVINGPPGAGKSTLLKIIAGLINPDEGDIFIGENRVNDVPANERGVGMLFETPAIYPNLTGFDNIAFPLRIKKISEDEVKKKVKEVADFLQISHLLNRKPTTYSGGELQRVALARVLVRTPSILLLDEPLKNLDAKIRESMRVELKRLQRELGITTIFATHDQLEALTIGDRIAVINEGVIHQIDIPENVYNYPKTVFTARFIGSPPINLIECTLEKEGGKCILKTPEFKLDFTEYVKLFENYENGYKFLLGIRPEDIILHKEAKEATGIIGTVQLIDNVGDEKIVSIKINDKVLTSIVGKETILDYGQKVYIEINMDKVHVFDIKDNKSIL